MTDRHVAGVRKLCCVTSNLTGVEQNQLVKKKKRKMLFFSGYKYYVCTFDVHVIIAPADLRFELWFEGQKFSGNHEPISVQWDDASLAAPNLLPPPQLARPLTQTTNHAEPKVEVNEGYQSSIFSSPLPTLFYQLPRQSQTSLHTFLGQQSPQFDRENSGSSPFSDTSRPQSLQSSSIALSKGFADGSEHVSSADQVNILRAGYKSVDFGGLAYPQTNLYQLAELPITRLRSFPANAKELPS